MELAALYGVQLSYRDSNRREQHPPLESIVAVLRSLGAELGDGGGGLLPSGAAGLSDRALAAAIKAHKLQQWRQMVDPVLLAWNGVLPQAVVRLPVAATGQGRPRESSLRCTLTLEDGAVQVWDVNLAHSTLIEADTLGRERFQILKLGLKGPQSRRLPLGFHTLCVELGGLQGESVVISAPRRCWSPTNVAVEWGIFAPLYSLRSDRDWGAGDLADLESLACWTAGRGGSVVATLPLLAAYLDTPFEPSPYRPVSRLFWNEFYLAVDRIPEWERCQAAREIWASAEGQDQVSSLRAAPFVDYRAVMALKRRVLEELARCFFDGEDAHREAAFSSYLAAQPEAREYAAFRAGVEAAGADWRDWREVPAEGRPRGAAESEMYHLYSQWQLDEQLSWMSGCGAESAAGGAAGASAGVKPGLFLDLPLGAHPGGFDTWRWPELFASGMSAGAPPDTFFAHGQDWEFPPLHPTCARERGHQYFAACLRTHMRHAAYLRIDHVMSLHRLFWVPAGAEPAEGVYVTYPAEELYAVLSLESHRNQTVVVGEDLGTVPPEVRPAMRRHGVLRTWVFQAALRPRAADPVGPVPAGSVASINTHDMFPYAGFVLGDDIFARVRTGQLEEAGARREIAARRRLVTRLDAWLLRVSPSPGAPEAAMSDLMPEEAPSEAGGSLRRALAYLAHSRARLAIVSLDDLLLETRPQNVPGTGVDWGNWRRKLLDVRPRKS